MVKRRRKAAAPSGVRAVGYVRVSTSKQDLGPEAQRAAIARWAEREGVDVVAVYEDLGITGAADIGDRPGLVSALAALPAQKATVLVAAKLDRLSRDAYVMGSIDREAARARARVVTADGATDDELRRDFDVLISAHERRLIKQRTRAALAVKRARGERVGAVPYGYKVAADGVHLEPEPKEQRVIARARELNVDGVSFAKIAARLTAEGYASRAGTPFLPMSVRRMCVGASS
jgi:DNA invertase Pin-like site-specific DNA recombinase